MLDSNIAYWITLVFLVTFQRVYESVCRWYLHCSTFDDWKQHLRHDYYYYYLFVTWCNLHLCISTVQMSFFNWIDIKSGFASNIRFQKIHISRGLFNIHETGVDLRALNEGYCIYCFVACVVDLLWISHWIV